MKPIPELLEIEYELYEEFTRCGVQLCDTKPEEGYQEWDWYFLNAAPWCSHAHARLVGWSADRVTLCFAGQTNGRPRPGVCLWDELHF